MQFNLQAVQDSAKTTHPSSTSRFGGDEISRNVLANTFRSLLQTYHYLIIFVIFFNTTPTQQGYVCGNPVTDRQFDTDGVVPFLHGMGLIPYELYEVTLTQPYHI